jgi:glycosyltransferase involved in cell wall biosynthesis
MDQSVVEHVTGVRRPLVSVLTPFYNTVPYLAQCIESVLAQSYTNFEYILVDNCSTDGSSRIAENYARRDSRIRLIRRPELLPQLRNYNDALTNISDESQYCKIVQADDSIFPQCLELMLHAFLQSESIGLVSSYWLEGSGASEPSTLFGTGYPYPQAMLSGKECARFYLRTGVYVFGSQTTVMYRSRIVKDNQPFYDESFPAADFDRCMQILKSWDFGFVHQLLSFTRRGNESIVSARLPFKPFDMDRYVAVKRHASTFLEPNEAACIRKKVKQVYYRLLAEQALRFRERAFWQYHESGLKTADETLDWFYLAIQIVIVLLWMGLNPGKTILNALRSRKRRMTAKTAHQRANGPTEPLNRSPTLAARNRSLG